MNKLPIELHVCILNYLDLDQLLNCRLLNKYFNSAIQNNIKIKNLSIVKNYCYDCDIFCNREKFSGDCDYFSKFYLTNECVAKKNSTFKLISIESKFFETFLINLKRLYFSFGHNMSLEYLNRFDKFDKLEHLEIKNYILEKNMIIKLPNIKILSIKPSIRPDERPNNFILSFDLPKLTTLRLTGLRNFEFVNAESIRNLDIYSIQIHDNIEMFKNVDYLFHRGSNVNYENHFEWFCRLKKINLSIWWTSIKKLFENFSPKTEIYFKGIKLDENNLNNLYDHKILTIYDKITVPLDMDFSLDYNLLIRTFNCVPNDFYKKILYVRLLRIDGNEVKLDQIQLINLIKHYKDLKVLAFESTPFDNEFYNNLHFYVKLLRRFFIFKPKKPINYDFLLNFKYLGYVHIDRELSSKTFKILKAKLNHLTWEDSEGNRKYFVKP